MKVFILKLILSALTFILSIFSANAQMNAYWADTLTQTLAQIQVDEGMKGVASAVVFSDGTVWSSAAGNHGNTALTTDMLYDIGSNTKSLVATVMLQLQEEGALSLDDTLYHFISPIPNVSNGITLRQLLQHRSGVFNFTNHPDFSPEINTNDSKFWHPDSILARFVDVPNFAPGMDSRYSNTGYILLGKVIEEVENKPFHEVLRERVFDLAGVENIYTDQYDTYNQIKTGAWFPSGNYFEDDFVSFMSAAWAAGAVVSTPEAFARVSHQMLRGDLFSAASLEEMQTGTQFGSATTYGLGLYKRYYKGDFYLGHGGTTLQNSEMEHNIEADFTVILFNIDQGHFDQTTRAKFKLMDLVDYIEEVHVDTIATAITEVSNQAVEVLTFPNPSNAEMTIRLTDATAAAGNTNVEIRDLTGRMVYQQGLWNGEVSIQKAEIGSGIYIANVFNGQTLLSSQRIIFN